MSRGLLATRLAVAAVLVVVSTTPCLAQNPELDSGITASTSYNSWLHRMPVSGSGNQVFFTASPDGGVDVLDLTAPGNGYGDRVRARLAGVPALNRPIRALAIDDPKDGPPTKLAYAGGINSDSIITVLDLRTGDSTTHPICPLPCPFAIVALEMSRDGSQLVVFSYDLGFGQAKIQTLCLLPDCSPELTSIDQLSCSGGATCLLGGTPNGFEAGSQGNRWITDDGSRIVYARAGELATSTSSVSTGPGGTPVVSWSAPTALIDVDVTVRGAAIDGAGSTIVFSAMDALPGLCGPPSPPEVLRTPALFALEPNTPGTPCKLIAQPATGSGDSPLFLLDLAISRDGRHLFWSAALDYDRNVPASATPSFELFTIPIDAEDPFGGATQLTRDATVSPRLPAPNGNGDVISFITGVNTTIPGTGRLKLMNRVDASESPLPLTLGEDPGAPFELREVACGGGTCSGTALTCLSAPAGTAPYTVLTWHGWLTDEGDRLFPAPTIQPFAAGGIESQVMTSGPIPSIPGITLTDHLFRVVGAGEQFDVAEISTSF
ncbi:MAG: hypothetical protein AAF533_11825 [Acidobacteriota bacterium]